MKTAEMESVLQAAEADGLLSEELELGAILRAAGKPCRPMTAEALRNVSSAYAARGLLEASQISTAEMLERLGDAPRNAELAEAVASGLPQDILEEALRQPDGFARTADALRIAAANIPPPPPAVFSADGRNHRPEIQLRNCRTASFFSTANGSTVSGRMTSLSSSGWTWDEPQNGQSEALLDGSRS